MPLPGVQDPFARRNAGAGPFFQREEEAKRKEEAARAQEAADVADVGATLPLAETPAEAAAKKAEQERLTQEQADIEQVGKLVPKGPVTPGQKAVEAQRQAEEAARQAVVPTFAEPDQQAIFDVITGAADIPGGFSAANQTVLTQIQDFISSNFSEETKPQEKKFLEDFPGTEAPPLGWDMSAGGQWRWNGTTWVPTPTRITALAEYANAITAWRNDFVRGLQALGTVSASNLGAVVALITQQIGQQWEAGMAQQGQAFELTKEGVRFKNDLALVATGHANAVQLQELANNAAMQVVDKQNEGAMARLALQEEGLNTRAEMQDAIDKGNLGELVRSNKKLEELKGKELELDEQKQKWDFLGDMLSNGGLGFFTMALIDPNAAQALFGQLTGGTVSGTMGGPFAAAQQFRTQQEQFGAFTTPSAQQVAQASPVELGWWQAAFQGQGRDIAAEVERLTPESAAAQREV